MPREQALVPEQENIGVRNVTRLNIIHFPFVDFCRQTGMIPQVSATPYHQGIGHTHFMLRKGIFFM